MATPTLTSLMTDVLLNPTAPTNLGTGNAQASETVIQLVGTSCAATGHAGAVGPTSNPTIAAMRGMYSTVTSIARVSNKHIHAWVRDLYPIRNVNLGGVSLYTFDGTEKAFFITGLDKGYKGGWQHAVLSIDNANKPAPSIGTAGTAGITRVGYLGNISASKGESFLQNCYLDAIRTSTGNCLRFSGGTSGDPFTWATMPLADTAEYGIVRNVSGAIFMEGGIDIGGTALTTYMTDNLRTITMQALTVNNGAGGATVVPAVTNNYYRIDIQPGTATVVNWTDITILGYSGSPFWLNADGLTAANNSASFTRCSFVDFESFLVGANCTVVGCTFVNGGANGVSTTAATAFTDCTFSNCRSVQLTGFGQTINGGRTNGHTTAAGEYFVIADSLNDIANHDFDNTGGNGHAIAIFTPGTYTLTNVTFTGYGADASNDAAIYNNSGGLVTVSISGGSVPTVRNGAGASTVILSGVDFTLTNVVSGSSFMLDLEYVTALPAGTYNGTGDTILRMTTTIATEIASSGTVRIFNGTYWDKYTYTGKSGTDLTGISPALTQDYNAQPVLLEIVAPTTITVDPYTASVPANANFRARVAKATGGTLYQPVYFTGNTGSGFSRRVEQVEDA